MSDLNPAEGGKARAAKLTPTRRREIAIKAAETRWAKAGKEPIPVAKYGSPDRPLCIGEIKIPCYVLDNGTRVLAQRGMISGLGMSSGSASGAGDRLVSFVSGDRIKDLISSELGVLIRNPIKFRTGGTTVHGYPATILADICEAVLNAREAGRLQKQQDHIARHCEALVRGFARVGIVALVDEATGYQDERARDALAKILEEFVTKELQPWVKMFPPEYYREIYRLRSWNWPPKRNKHNSVLGKYTNDLIYDRLAPGVREELHRLTPRNERTGRLKHKLHQHLTPDRGNPKLRAHLASVIMALKISRTWDELKESMDRHLPKYPQGPTLFDYYDGSL